MEYHRVCAIDVGLVNFAWCIIDNTTCFAPIAWSRENIWGKKKKPTKNDVVGAVVAWVRRHQPVLNSCTAIVLENQMRGKFVAMNAALHALFYDKVRVVHPFTMCNFWGLPRTRAEKKAATVELVRHHIAVFPVGGKADDLADAWIMAVWHLIDLGVLAKGLFLEAPK